MEKMDCRSCLEEEITEICLENNIKKFRANQVFKWLHQKGAHAWEEMKNICALKGVTLNAQVPIPSFIHGIKLEHCNLT